MLHNYFKCLRGEIREKESPAWHGWVYVVIEESKTCYIEGNYNETLSEGRYGIYYLINIIFCL